ncbi:MAG: hypothetical protein KAR42_14485 [candidate division Zixibacteria bacterium]|nr:hypothetical protein [candidate division Zixibacteria bacterium]
MNSLNIKNSIAPKSFFLLFIILAFCFLNQDSTAANFSKKIKVSNSNVINLGVSNIAAGSDSLFCQGTLIPRDSYRIDYRSGVVYLGSTVACDTISIKGYQIPEWMLLPEGNAVPEGKRFIALNSDAFQNIGRNSANARKVNLSGHKSFSFLVGRSGEGSFSQGLNLEVDALLADNLRLRGAVSDRIGSNGNTPSGIGFGGTTTISELDKYFFELTGSRVSARAGDIRSITNDYLPQKRIKGLQAEYRSRNFSTAVDIGRPAGTYASYRFNGSDGKQGPYQVRSSNGLPSGIVPGSEKVYLDGRKLEGGANRNYEIHYPSGRITFTPRQVITSQSRIEIDFEAASTDYEREIYNISQSYSLFNEKIKFQIGGRRESDSKSRLRFGALSSSDIEIITNAGDESSGSFRSGVTPDTSGAYILQTDSTGVEYYQYVGEGIGDYAILLSYVGDNQGEYIYLGNGVYQFAGTGNGNYQPIIYLPLPSRTDFWYSSLDAVLYNSGRLTLSYQGVSHDKNLFSPKDDSDNYRSFIESEFTHKGERVSTRFYFRFLQDGFRTITRINSADFSRLWALPADTVFGDELQVLSNQQYSSNNNSLETFFGYLNRKDNLRSRRVSVDADLLKGFILSPKLSYSSGNSKKLTESDKKGVYESQRAVIAFKPKAAFHVETRFEREFIKDTYGTEPTVERFSRFKSLLFYRNSIISFSRRVDFNARPLGYKGPRIDEYKLTSEESIGKLRMSLAATIIKQDKQDSDRENREDYLFVSTFRYSGKNGWITFQADYRQNRRTSAGTGFRYIYVGSGQGEYRKEDGQYLFDENGDYIRIREERGEAQSVLLGEKSHNIFIYPGRIARGGKWKNVLSKIALRLKTNIVGEVPGKDRRKIGWILPWYSQSGLTYSNRIRREKYSALVFPSQNFYRVNFSYQNAFEEQDAGGLLYKNSKEYKAELKTELSTTVRFIADGTHRRNNEAGIGLSSIKLKSNLFGLSVVFNDRSIQIHPRIEYELFVDEISGGEGNGISVSNTLVVRNFERGEIRFVTEFSSLIEKKKFTQPEYLITGGKRFGNSGLMTFIANYKLRKSVRIIINITDRFYENRSAEFTGRGELVASF